MTRFVTFYRAAAWFCLCAQGCRSIEHPCCRERACRQMHRGALQDIAGNGGSGQSCDNAVAILEALLRGPGFETCDATGKDFIAALASMPQSLIMANTNSKAVLQFKKLLRGIFMPDSTKCICSHAALAMFRLCRCLLTMDASPQVQRLVVQAFKSAWGPQSPDGPSMHQVTFYQAAMAGYLFVRTSTCNFGSDLLQMIGEAVGCLGRSCANDSPEERHNAVVIGSIWDALDQILGQLVPLATGGHAGQALQTNIPRPAVLLPSGMAINGEVVCSTT